MRYLENVVPVSIRDLQGEGDDARMLFNLRLAFDRLKQLRAGDAKFITFPGMAHSFDLSAVDWEEFYGSAVRQPLDSLAAAGVFVERRNASKKLIIINLLEVKSRI